MYDNENIIPHIKRHTSTSEDLLRFMGNDFNMRIFQTRGDLKYEETREIDGYLLYATDVVLHTYEHWWSSSLEMI